MNDFCLQREGERKTCVAHERQDIQRRDEREFERRLLALAKDRHRQVYGAGAPINRVKIRKFKRDFRK